MTLVNPFYHIHICYHFFWFNCSNILTTISYNSLYPVVNISIYINYSLNLITLNNLARINWLYHLYFCYRVSYFSSQYTLPSNARDGLVEIKITALTTRSNFQPWYLHQFWSKSYQIETTNSGECALFHMIFPYFSLFFPSSMLPPQMNEVS